MNAECEFIVSCSFLKKHGEAAELACRGLMRMYCRGEKLEECVRRQHRLQTGRPPTDDILPNGKKVIDLH